ncbi:urease accessory protein UreD [Deinococcus sp.]|uniref:urease accessory protein UreD n=1 Tax=Deinococcus sp. TaxID=47478 RepID=UPI0025C18C61|nr:urease accessory protein UreD [Deinococcus sp.]
MTLFSRTRFGQLDLHFARRGQKTVLLRDLQKAPLMIVRPFELPCGTLMVFIVNPTGGVLGGDHSEIRVTVGEGATVVILTQSATRLQPSPDGAAALQHIFFEVGPGARLEYYPERTIPFAGSRFAQDIQVNLSATSEFGLTESLASGRVQMGERLAFGSYASRVAIYRDGQRVFLDAQRFDHTATDLKTARAAGVWGGMDYVGSGVWLGQQPAAFHLACAPLEADAQVVWGKGQGGALWLRGAAQQGPRLDERLASVRNQIRHEWFGAAPLQIRR